MSAAQIKAMETRITAAENRLKLDPGNRRIIKGLEEMTRALYNLKRAKAPKKKGTNRSTLKSKNIG